MILWSLREAGLSVAATLHSWTADCALHLLKRQSYRYEQAMVPMVLRSRYALGLVDLPELRLGLFVDAQEGRERSDMEEEELQGGLVQEVERLQTAWLLEMGRAADHGDRGA